MNVCVWESMCEMQEICKKEKVLGIWALDGAPAISRYMVVVASKVRYFVVLNSILAIFSDIVSKKCISLSDCTRITSSKIQETEEIARFSLNPFKEIFWLTVHDQYYCRQI